MIQYDVLGVGNAIVDILANVSDAFLKDFNLPKGGTTLINETQADMLYKAMPPGQASSGGSAANTIAGLASFGANTAFIGKVRDDELGDIFRHDMQALGVNFDTKPAKTGATTARCFVAITPDAERTMSTYLGASAGLSPADILKPTVITSGIIYLEGYLWDTPAAIDAMKQVIAYAKTYGRKVAFSLSDLFCVERHHTDFLALVEEDIDILFGNEDEIKALFHVDDVESEVKKIMDHCEIVAITMGSKGSYVVADKIYFCEANADVNVVDTTGAGDLYAAGFLYGYSQGFSPKKCAELGTLAAAEVISHIGGRSQQPLHALAQQHGLIHP